MSTYIGTIYNDVSYYSDQVQYGLDGNDVLAPNADNKPYFLYGGEGADDLWGYSYSDELYGGRGSDYLNGLNGNDLLEGGSGNDFLRGGYGDDLLEGGSGSDAFIFDTSLNAKHNVDKITDFQPGQDFVYLDSTIFKKAGPDGEYLKAKKFEIGKHADDKKDRIIYDDKKGVLKYDPDGTGSDKATKFAKLDSDLNLHHDDFFVI